MEQEKVQNQYTIKVSDSFEKTDEKFNYEVAFRRWLVREMEKQRMTVHEAVRQFNFNPENGPPFITHWRKKYAPEMVLSSQAMTVAEKKILAE